MKSNNEILITIKDLPQECFDGHTEFCKLSPKDKLRWLSESAFFIYKISLQNPNLGCSRFFKKKITPEGVIKK